MKNGAKLKIKFKKEYFPKFPKFSGIDTTKKKQENLDKF